jgi:hypothetical protein
MAMWLNPRDFGIALMLAPFVLHSARAVNMAQWLRTSVRGHTLWAWNDRHLDLVADVVAARQRKRPKTASPTTTLVNALPKWMKAGDSRDAVLAGISRLRQRLASTNGADGPSG